MPDYPSRKGIYSYIFERLPGTLPICGASPKWSECSPVMNSLIAVARKLAAHLCQSAIDVADAAIAKVLDAVMDGFHRSWIRAQCRGRIWFGAACGELVALDLADGAWGRR